MKKLTALLLALLLCITAGCTAPADNDKDSAFTLVASTYPVYVFTSRVIEGCDGVELKLLVDQSISCLHDYTLSVTDMKKIDSADALIINGAGLEVFLDDIVASYANLPVIDSSEGVELLESSCSHEEHSAHSHDKDPHIWLDPLNAAKQTENISHALSEQLPDYKEQFEANAAEYVTILNELDNELKAVLSALDCRKIITFHDGFAYFAKALDLEVLQSIEEESGSEASAQEIAHICGLIKEHSLPAVFTEVSGSDATAKAISNETGVGVYRLDMIMTGNHTVDNSDGYIDAMRKNVAVIKEALAS